MNSINYINSNSNWNGTTGGTENMRYEICGECGGNGWNTGGQCSKCMGQGGQWIYEPIIVSPNTYTVDPHGQWIYEPIIVSPNTYTVDPHGNLIPYTPSKQSPTRVGKGILRPGGGLIKSQEDGLDRAIRRLKELKKVE